MSKSDQPIEVAVGVIFNALGQVLVAKRRPHQHLSECWEFPGGKIEPGESHVQALKRELFEEIGIQVIDHEPWLIVEHDYEEKSVRLIVHKIIQFNGEARGCEGQTIQWLIPQALAELPLPPANEVIVQALQK